MGYHYYNYQAYFEKEKNYSIEDFCQALAEFNILESTSALITLGFDGWKFWLELNPAEHIAEEALEIAKIFNNPILHNCNARLEIYAEDDPGEIHYNDHLHVLETLAALPGIYIFDPASGEFPYEASEELPVIETSFLEHIADDDELNEAVDTILEFPYGSPSWYKLGLSYYRHGKIRIAIECFKNTILLDKDDSYAYHYLGISYTDLDEYQAARENLLKAIELNPRNLDFLVTLGILYAHQKDKTNALECLKKAVQQDPENNYANANLGYYLLFFKEAEKALPYIEKSISLGGEDISFFNKGHFHLTQGNKLEAVLWYAKSLQLYDEEPEFWEDFDRDFKLMSQYGISLRTYNGLKPKIRRASKKEKNNHSTGENQRYEFKIWALLVRFWQKLKGKG